MISLWEKEFINSHRIARLATVADTGQPHLVPIVYAFDGERLYTPIDAKPKRVAASQLRRVRNIRAHPHVAVLIDDYAEDWTQLAWVQMRGTAKLVEAGLERESGIALLDKKYPQYQTMPLGEKPVIVITPEHITSWRAGK